MDRQILARLGPVPDPASAQPAVAGWFSTEGEPHLVGGRCLTCGTYVFPPRTAGCPNPDCVGDELELVALSRRGTVWSYTENRYAPPAPFPASEPFEPYALAAVELAAEGLVVLGQVARGVLAADLSVGMTVELGVQTLYRDDDGVDRLVYVWTPTAAQPRAGDR